MQRRTLKYLLGQPMRTLLTNNDRMSAIATISIAAAFSFLALLAGCSAGQGSDCGPANCSTGCCHPVVGCIQLADQSAAAGGVGGAACQACAEGSVRDITTGECVGDGTIRQVDGDGPCGPSCNGCCNPQTNKCVAIDAQSNDQCGYGDRDCIKCGSAENCVTGQCKSGGSSNPDECHPMLECYSELTGRCEGGYSTSFCGRGGTCEKCPTGTACNAQGKCVQDALECQQRCAGTGCCDEANNCIKFETYDLFSLTGISSSAVQSDSKCGTTACMACPSDQPHCDTAKGECESETAEKEYKICVKRVMLKSDPIDTAIPELAECQNSCVKVTDTVATTTCGSRGSATYSTDGLICTNDDVTACKEACKDKYLDTGWLDFTGEDAPDISVRIAINNESATTASRNNGTDNYKYTATQMQIDYDRETNQTLSFLNSFMSENVVGGVSGGTATALGTLAIAALKKSIPGMIIGGLASVMITKYASYFGGDASVYNLKKNDYSWEGFAITYQECPLTLPASKLDSNTLKFTVLEDNTFAKDVIYGACEIDVTGLDQLGTECDQTKLDQCTKSCKSLYGNKTSSLKACGELCITGQIACMGKTGQGKLLLDAFGSNPTASDGSKPDTELPIDCGPGRSGATNIPDNVIVLQAYIIPAT